MCIVVENTGVYVFICNTKIRLLGRGLQCRGLTETRECDLADHTYLFQGNGRFVCNWVTILKCFMTTGDLCAIG